MQINRELLNSAVYRIAFYPQSVGAIKLYTAEAAPTLRLGGKSNGFQIAARLQSSMTPTPSRFEIFVP